MPTPTHFVQIDEVGRLIYQEKSIRDPQIIKNFFSDLKIHTGGTLISQLNDVPVIVEAFDEPIIAHQIECKSNQWILRNIDQIEYTFSLTNLSLDEWDRFHGYCENQLPFVMDRHAQNQFFKLLEDFDDDNIYFGGQSIATPQYWENKIDVEDSNFWTEIYHAEGNPGWNIGDAAPALKDMLPRLKLAKSKIVILGCGEGHDAAYFAQHGHLVTAVDFSEEAISRAQKNYGHIENLNFIQADVFDLPKDWDQQFDIVFEHTCYCAINPSLRQELVKVWTRLLHHQGYLMGIFFAMEKRKGPPFGGSEWELRERLRKKFQFVFWGRWQQSIEQRQGKELFLYAKKMDVK